MPYRMIANLGDASPFDYGGYFVYVDGDRPQAELLEVLDTDDEKSEYHVYRFDLDRCTCTNGVLSDNPFHPDHSVWFAPSEAEKLARPQDGRGLDAIADFCGMDIDELRAAFCSENVIERAHAWRTVGEYHGWDELDQYPLTLTRAECTRRYNFDLARLRKLSKV